MGVSVGLFSLAILHAGYLAQLCFRQPSSKKILTPSESRIIWYAVSPDNMVVVRIATVCLCSYHALVSLAIAQTPFDSDQVLHRICPVLEYLDMSLFTWSNQTVWPLVLLYLGCYARFQAYTQLGSNFTYRLAKPDDLVSDGLYAYVRHPSYSGLFCVLIALYTLFLNQHGLVSCWLPAISPSLGRALVVDTKFRCLLPVIGFSMVTWLIMVKRVQEEEQMMEQKFGQRWRQYCVKTKKFIPFLL
ncbi:hypothetical protein BKA66DRAFT_441777 [Pyrenochaeta sp. MPI-SDFR-AT-0127]|nr:hypothetical protein BKA66DRAFT_441777 [Pyrenochaeta sp. MPI-SDFR-AT-0127]